MRSLKIFCFAFLMLHLVSCLYGQDTYNMEQIDSMENLLDEDISDTLRIELLKKLSSNVLDKQKGLNYILEAKKLRIKHNLPYDDNIDYKLAFLYFVNRQEDKAAKIYRDLKHLYEEKDSIPGKIRTYYYLARINSRKLNIDKSNEYYMRALHLVDSAEVDTMKSFIYNGLGYFHFNYTGEYPTARKFFKKGLDISIKVSDDFGYKQSMLALSRLELRAGNLKESFKYANTMLDTALAKEDTLVLPSIYNSLGNLYEVTEQFEKALSLYRQSAELPRGEVLDREQYVSYVNMSDVYYKQKKLDSSEFYLQKSLKIAEGLNGAMDIVGIYDRFHRLYAEKKDFEKAYEYTILLMESWNGFQAEKIDNIRAEMRLEMELDAQEDEMMHLKQEREIQRLQINRNNYYFIGLAVLIILILVVGYVLIRQNRIKAKRRVNELTNRNLRQQMNPHFIFNTLNSIQYLLFKNRKMEANNYLSKFASLMRKLLDNSQFQSIPISQEIEALKLYIELESLRFKDKIEYSIGIDENIDVFEYKIPTMIIQPYVENSINHGLLNKEGKGALTVKMELQGEKIYCEIKDDGIGRVKAAEIRKSTNGSHNSLASSITESRLKLMSNLYGNKFQVNIFDLQDEKGEATGTKVCLTMPVLT